MKEWHFFDKVYRVWFIYVQGTTEEFQKFLDQHGYTGEKIVPSKGMCINLCEDNNSEGNNATVMWLPKRNYAAFVHELTHLVHFILNDKGIPLSLENTETSAYYVEFWYTAITKAWRSHPQGISPKEVTAAL